jgi:gliding motility-associated-like protein
MGKLLPVFLLTLILFSPSRSASQIVVTTNNNGNQLAQTLAGAGVTISNVQMNCPSVAAGTFTCNNCNVGMSSGIVLTSGDAQLVAGPNNSGSQGLDNLAPGNPDLDILAGATTYDACTLEFDMEVLSDSVEFRYVFGSEEYLEWVSAGFNDAFAFFISGPGIVGQQNIALVPGTATPVTIDNVNDVSYSQYYVDNGTGFTAPQNTSPYYIQYDGFTTVLTAKRKNLQPCQTYHLRLTIADAGDGIYDSGVFLEANSLISNSIQVDDATTGNPNVSNAMEGCIDGSIRFFIETPVNYPITIHYGIGGSAINGTDYTHIADSIILPANDSDVYLNIHPIADGLVEGTETLVIYLYNACNNLPYDSSVLVIVDSFGVALTGDTTICAGASVQLHASGSFNYLWSPAATLDNNTIPNPTATPTATTTYICTSNIAGCISADSVTVTVIPPPFSVNAGPDIIDCSGLPIQLNAVVTGNPLGGIPFQYAWSPANTLNNPAILNPVSNTTVNTTYVIDVNSGSCKASDTVNVTVGSLTISASAINTSCFGGNNGTATVTVQNPNGNYTYLWNNNAVTQTITGLTAGNYTVTVTQNGICTASASATVQSPSAIVFATPSITNLTCFGANDGSITVSATGGTGSLSYLWNTGANTATLSSLPAGVYTVTATDTNNCSASINATVTSPAQLMLTPSQTNVSCFGGSNGTATVTPTGGTGTITYLWSGGQTTSSINNQPVGNYSVTATDANNCSASATFNITSPPILTISATGVDVTCFGGSDGAVNTSTTGGAGGNTYLWSNGANSPNLSNVPVNNYTVTVTDANSCTASASAAITSPTALTISGSQTNVTCFGGNDGSATINAAGGAGGTTYLWSNSGTGPTINYLSAGNYSVTVSDVNACTVTAAFTITSPSPLLLTTAFTDVLCFGGNDGTANVTASGGVLPYSYLWSNNAVTPGIFGLTANTYNVLVTDSHQCTASAVVNVSQPTPLQLVATATNEVCPGDNNGIIHCNAQGSVPGYSFSLVLNGSAVANNTTGYFNNLTPGIYTIVVTDAHNCNAQQNATVSAAQPDVFNYTADSTSCYGNNYNDGTITIVPVSNQNSPYYYSVDGLNSQLTGDFYNLSAGLHKVTVVNNKGCVTDTTLMVIEPPLGTVDILPTDTTIQAGGSIQLVSSLTNYGPMDVLSYNWSPESGLSCIDCPNPIMYGYQSSRYVLTVLYGKNCVATATTTIYVTGEPPVYIPNAFTPNGDGNNDVWTVYGKDILTLDLDLFNRWGEKVCTFTSQFDSWDGTYQQILQPPGVYVYNVSITFLSGRKIHRTGSVTLVR